MPTSPFQVYFPTKSQLTITITEPLRDAAWAAYFGEIQYYLRNQTLEIFDPKLMEVVFDLSPCEWADPLPLLSIIIAIAEFQDAPNKTRIKLPAIKNSSLSTKRFLKYLAKERFASQFLKFASEVFDDDGLVTENHLENYENLSTELAYVNSTCIPAEIIDAKSINIEDIVNDKIQYAESRLGADIPFWARENLCYRLKVLLRETLLNVKTHAYPHQNLCYAGFYVRYREGLTNKSKEVHKTMLEVLKKEDNHLSCPLLPLSYLEERHGCFEVFVIDSGIGMSQSMRSVIRTNKGTVPGYPFRASS